jgi:stage V sporulation protein SpoVS
MSDKHVVPDVDAFANKAMARNFAALAYPRILLDFNEGSNLRFIPDFTPIKVDESGKPDIRTQLHIF